MKKILAKIHSMPFTPTSFSKLNPDQPYFVKTSYIKFHKNLTNSSLANTKSQMGRQGLHKRCFLHFLKSILHTGIKLTLLFSVFLTCLLFFHNYCSPAFITSFPQSL